MGRKATNQQQQNPNLQHNDLYRRHTGRLAVSTEDGRRDDGLIDEVFTFGGRGFSLHNANNFNTPTAIVDSLEQVTKQYFGNVFNTAYLSDSSTPQSDREATSPILVRFVSVGLFVCLFGWSLACLGYLVGWLVIYCFFFVCLHVYLSVSLLACFFLCA